MKIPLTQIHLAAIAAIQDISAALEHTAQAEDARAAGARKAAVDSELDDATHDIRKAIDRLKNLDAKLTKIIDPNTPQVRLRPPPSDLSAKSDPSDL